MCVVFYHHRTGLFILNLCSCPTCLHLCPVFGFFTTETHNQARSHQLRIKSHTGTGRTERTSWDQNQNLPLQPIKQDQTWEILKPEETNLKTKSEGFTCSRGGRVTPASAPPAGLTDSFLTDDWSSDAALVPRGGRVQHVTTMFSWRYPPAVKWRKSK